MQYFDNTFNPYFMANLEQIMRYLFIKHAKNKLEIKNTYKPI